MGISSAPPVRVVEEIAPSAIFITKSGKTIIDFGQNLVGTLRIRSLNKPASHKVTFIHAEVLDKGELAIRPLRIAKCTDVVITSGEELQNWSPRYTFHGFRYVQVEGWTTDEPHPLSKSTISALVMHTDMVRTGWFSCLHPMVNKLHENALWSMRGNFLSIPTDCPQRDERLGWTGDIQVFCPSANFLYDTAGMLGDWLKDLASEQFEEAAKFHHSLFLTLFGSYGKASPKLSGTMYLYSPRGHYASLLEMWRPYVTNTKYGILGRFWNSS